VDYIAIAVTIAWLFAVLRLGVLNEVHHWMWGAWLYIGGRVVGNEWVMLVGLLVMLDDSVQHLVQLWEPNYRSPLWRFYAWLYPSLPRWLRW
jgi:hypothetical protein